uniref:Uncharacterized protein n=1 Tax=Leptocylindrus danicus TaxID=163516 RepID=A0A7S2P3V1_9STRA
MAILVGRVGWYSFWSDDGHFSSKRDLFLSLLPVVFLFFTSLHLSIAMWRYGTSLSLVVYPSYFNPWCKQFIGTLLLGAGQLFGEGWYTAMSNIGQVSFVLSIILEMNEVDKELVAEADFEDFLDEVEAYGNRICLGGSSVASNRNGKTTTASTMP